MKLIKGSDGSEVGLPDIWNISETQVIRNKHSRKNIIRIINTLEITVLKEYLLTTKLYLG